MKISFHKRKLLARPLQEVYSMAKGLDKFDGLAAKEMRPPDYFGDLMSKYR